MMCSTGKLFALMGSLLALLASLTCNYPVVVEKYLAGCAGCEALGLFQVSTQSEKASDAIVHQLARSTQAKDRIINELMRRQRTLLEAAAIFEQLEDIMRPLKETSTIPLRDQSAAWCRRVIQHVQRDACGTENQRERTIERLSTELRSLLEHRQLVLPTLSPAALGALHAPMSVAVVQPNTDA